MPSGAALKGKEAFVQIKRTKDHYKTVTRFSDQKGSSGGLGREGL